MNQTNEDLHGNAPDSSPVALLVIDMINDLEFPEGPDFLEPTLAAACQIAALKQRAKEAGIPVLYVNDNFGKWRSNFDDLLTHCLTDHVRGKPVVERIRPDADDYRVLKPKHSIFYATTLETLLTYLQTNTLIMTGIAADVCILFSAIDAYVRDLKLIVPPDCVASGSAPNTEAALAYMQRVLSADITPSAEIDLAGLVG
ncbi:cysteine hydrolase family protein [Fibrella forsythiae]|uniref:Cysteine hydrolase n=1 Tax=Fibrella forsythiae TaxID=2817061 RepID=A0ABS3JII8_9BACT|nr:isochorismatase family cysteine hydrolase [Fibrella forsythiae]MBO0949231.1 cysteine hydrolase [Fibrella forsythiae]